MASAKIYISASQRSQGTVHTCIFRILWGYIRVYFFLCFNICTRHEAHRAHAHTVCTTQLDNWRALCFPKAGWIQVRSFEALHIRNSTEFEKGAEFEISTGVWIPWRHNLWRQNLRGSSFLFHMYPKKFQKISE